MSRPRSPWFWRRARPACSFGPPRAGASPGTPISELSPTLGWRARAGGSQRIRREDFEVTVSINGVGSAGAGDPLRARARSSPGRHHGGLVRPRLLRGGAETLQGTARARPCNPAGVDVINAGSPGYSTDQEWLYFDEEISRYRPSEVLLLFYYNDLHFNLERVGTANRSKPVFEQKDGALELVPPVIDPATPDKRGARRPARRGGASVPGVGAVGLRGRPPAAQPSRLVEVPLAVWPGAPTLDRASRGVPSLRAEGEARGANGWRRCGSERRRSCGRFRDDVRQRGARLSVFYVPARFEANDEAWTFVRRRYDDDRPWARDAVRLRLTGVLALWPFPSWTRPPPSGPRRGRSQPGLSCPSMDTGMPAGTKSLSRAFSP